MYCKMVDSFTTFKLSELALIKMEQPFLGSLKLILRRKILVDLLKNTNLKMTEVVKIRTILPFQ